MIDNDRINVLSMKHDVIHRTENMELNAEWEKFRGGPVVATQNRMHVTLNEKGDIFLNGNTHRVLGGPAAVALYYNREKDAIAVEPADARLPENFPVKQKMSGWIIHARPFCRHFGIKVSATESFNRPEIDTTGALLLELRNTVTVKGTSRKPRKSHTPIIAAG